MDRGPVALFGALVAIGLGPALWLGVQIGDVTVPPVRDNAPIVRSEQKVDQPKTKGGEGAGAQDAADEPAVAPQPKRKSKTVPVTDPTPAASDTSDAGQDDESPAGPDPTEEQTSVVPSDEATEPGDENGDPNGDDNTGDDNNNGDAGQEQPPSPPTREQNGGSGETGGSAAMERV